MFQRKFSFVIYISSAVLALSGCADRDVPGDGMVTAPPAQSRDAVESPLAYVGAKTCAGCHEDEAQQWSGSHHELAMQVATDEFVRGDFADTTFAHDDIITSFYQRDGQYFTRTVGSDGESAEFPIRYAFGVAPLQQYLVELPDGKLQALSVAWDSRPGEDGGQRWFHVYGDERIDYTDILHWTRPSQNWDTMCADCHSTGLDKKYDIESDQFDTTWKEINVACEACHGPGSGHVAWAKSPDNAPGKGLEVNFFERRGITWNLDESTGNSQRSEARTTSVEINTCAPCHSRRARIADSPEPGDEFLDGYLPSLIVAPLYHVDGQIRDEVYVYGSFLQSRMYQRGVTCSDCHEPHSLELRAPGSQVCLQCHLGEKFATTEHHLHPSDSVGADCVECHMPPTTYMQVDPRHDHSFRIPRPELSVEFGTPNACTNCHTDKEANWAVQVLQSKGRLATGPVPHWSERFAKASQPSFGSQDLLVGLAADVTVPPVIRASAIVGLQLAGDNLAKTIVGEWAQSSDPMIRWAVARALQTAEPGDRFRYGVDLLEDPVKAVRIEIASALAPVGLELLPVSSYEKLERALAEFVDAQLVNAERAESHTNIANLERQLKRYDESEQSYLTALRLNSSFVPAYANLADLYREWENDAEGEKILRSGLEHLPNQPVLHHALGLTLIRLGRMPEAITELEIAADSDEADPRFALVYALALDSQGKASEGASYLEDALVRFGSDPGLVMALINIYQRSGDRQAAQAVVERYGGPSRDRVLN